MREVYRKRGRVVRIEGGQLVRIHESGEAIEDGDLFMCAPVAAPPLPEIDATRVIETARAVRGIAAGLAIERLIVSEGFAEHRFGDVAWSEKSERVLVAIAHRKLRALVHVASFDLRELEIVARALARAGEERAAPKRLVLEPWVTAALLTGRGVQTAGGLDGKGRPIEECDREPWPNCYRPSYRVRPVSVPLNIRLEPFGEIDGGAPRAVALLAPPSRVLVVDGDDVHPATVSLEHIRAVGEPGAWYPFGAGAFGAEMML